LNVSSQRSGEGEFLHGLGGYVGLADMPSLKAAPVKMSRKQISSSGTGFIQNSA